MGYEVHEMSNETHEKQHPATAVDIAFEMGVTVDRIGQVFRAFRNGGHPAFTGPFNRIAPLTPMQLAAIRGEDMPKPKEQDTSEAFLNCTDDSEPAKGLPNEVAPAGGLEAKRTLLTRLLEIEWRVQIFVLFAFCLVVGHAGFIWWDLSKLWGMAGTIGGGFVFVFILSGMVLMSEKSEKMKEVRENMLWAVTSLEALAVVVHQATFYRNAGEAFVAGLGVGYTGQLPL